MVAKTLIKRAATEVVCTIIPEVLEQWIYWFHLLNKGSMEVAYTLHYRTTLIELRVVAETVDTIVLEEL